MSETSQTESWVWEIDTREVDVIVDPTREHVKIEVGVDEQMLITKPEARELLDQLDEKVPEPSGDAT